MSKDEWSNIVPSVRFWFVATICSGRKHSFFVPSTCLLCLGMDFSRGEVSGEWGDRSSGVFRPPSNPAVTLVRVPGCASGNCWTLYFTRCVITQLKGTGPDLDYVTHLPKLRFHKTPHWSLAEMFIAVWETGFVHSRNMRLARNDIHPLRGKTRADGIAVEGHTTWVRWMLLGKKEYLSFICP